MVILDSASEPPQRSMAIDSAWRTLRLSNGFASVLNRQVDLAHPRRLLDGDALLERCLQLRALARRDAAELGLDLAALQGGHHRLRLDEDGAEAVEIGLALVEVLVEALGRSSASRRGARRTRRVRCPSRSWPGNWRPAPACRRCRCSCRAAPGCCRKRGVRRLQLHDHGRRDPAHRCWRCRRTAPCGSRRCRQAARAGGRRWP